MEDGSAEPVNTADMDAESKRLMVVSSQDLVMKDVPSTVNAFQTARGLLGKKCEETDAQHADSVYYCEMALLEPARMENDILGDSLEGMPEDEESDKDPRILSAFNLVDKEKEELRMQVYDAMSEKDEKANKVNEDSKGDSKPEEAKADEVTAETGAYGLRKEINNCEAEGDRKDLVLDSYAFRHVTGQSATDEGNEIRQKRVTNLADNWRSDNSSLVCQAERNDKTVETSQELVKRGLGGRVRRDPLSNLHTRV
ncbi:histone-binding protein N1/N2-like [Bufo bufo]|uniref:histone-binding protein N1/N2-like n=1 Tax=Bufo bufo TaxID=8384 RepID=UPI001ABE53BB|nr:histone-binding protein N1/N2-like [Bufo bufo]